ncbi:MAG: L-serine ammonia-lyase, iron-sulfur-dependent, subunit alpha [Oscillospiraceae bacterium]
MRELRIVCAYAFAVSEQNADNGTIVTAPTCGSAGVLPAVLLYMQRTHNIPDAQVLRALAVAGLFGALVKRNGSISGAECGCQAEIGTACSMAAAALCALMGLSIEETEYAAEIAMEHHLGLTCDPICGLVQIPCIERNAVAAEARHGRLQPVRPAVRLAQHQLRHGRTHDEGDRPAHQRKIPRDLRRRPCEAL